MYIVLVLGCCHTAYGGHCTHFGLFVFRASSIDATPRYASGNGYLSGYQSLGPIFSSILIFLDLF